MNPLEPEVWECDYDIEVDATPEAIWAYFEDVSGWKRWNAGIEEIQIRGPFEAGVEFVMKPTGQDWVTTCLREVQPNIGFIDETQVGELRIFVEHRIESIAECRCRVTYSIQAFGPGCDEIGPAVSADFPVVLRALKEMAETETAECRLDSVP